jgi:hypothetical protein
MQIPFILTMRPLALALSLLVSIVGGGTAAAATLSQKQAKALVSRMAGARFPGDAVRVKKITETGANAQATVEIETAFRVVQDKRGRWQIAELRTGQEQWEEIALIAEAANLQMPRDDCKRQERTGADLSPRNARCLIASLLKTDVPDAVRILDISTLGLPLASQASALVIALIQVEVRFSRDNGGWRASDLRTDNNDWVNLDLVVAGINERKRKQAEADLETLAQALEDYRKHSGFYVVSDKHPVLIDHLSPRYLPQIIRLDPWHQPYLYQGDRDHFLLRSKGPDGKENTADDVVLNGPQRRPS